MANLSHLREFTVFARYLNISKAADVLYLSQSNLSKHLKQLEAELGFSLLTKKGNQILLTDEGAHFLSGAQALISDYDSLVEECKLIAQDAFVKLTLQDPPYSDKAAAVFYEMANELRRRSKTARILFAHEKHKDRRQLLLDDEIQMLLEYHCAEATLVADRYAQQGMEAVEIAREPLVAWGSIELIGDVDEIDAERLRDFTIMVSTDAASPNSGLIAEIPEVMGFSPRVFMSPAQTAPQFYYSGGKRSVFLLPESHSRRELFTSRRDMRAARLVNSPLICRGFAVISKDGRQHDLLTPVLARAAAIDGGPATSGPKPASRPLRPRDAAGPDGPSAARGDARHSTAPPPRRGHPR